MNLQRLPSHHGEVSVMIGLLFMLDEISTKNVNKSVKIQLRMYASEILLTTFENIKALNKLVLRLTNTKSQRRQFHGSVMTTDMLSR